MTDLTEELSSLPSRPLDLDERDDLDTSYLYVECPAARRDQLVIEFQAKTGTETPPTGG